MRELTQTTIEWISPDKYKELGFEEDDLLAMWRKMVLIRHFEEMVESVFLAKEVKGLSHLCIGEEAIAVGITSAMRSNDLLVSHYRGHGHSLAKGVPPKLIMAEIFGKATGTCKGVGGSMHSAKYPEAGLMYATAIVGSGIPIAAGMALAIKRSKEERIVAVCFGDGATNTGLFTEGMNIASLWKLPLLFVCENNQYAMSTRFENAVAGPGITARAIAYGIPSAIVNGNDVIAVSVASQEAIKRARKGEGPKLIECRTYRMKGHGVYDKAPYRQAEEVEMWRKKDPIEAFRKTLLEGGIAKSERLDQIDLQTREDINDAVKFARESPIATLDELAMTIYK